MSGEREQLGLAVGAHQNRRLFPQHFLEERLPAWEEFRSVPVGDLLEEMRRLWEAERSELETANEAQTEDRWIQPVLRLLGFGWTVQADVPLPDGRRQPDYALFTSESDRQAAAGSEGLARYEHAAAVADAKRFGRPLDRSRVAGELSESPVAQIITYITITRRPWGILTNGRHWRLYSAAGDLVEGAHYEVDLVELLEGGTEDEFRLFAVLFSAAAMRRDADGLSLLDRVLAEGTANQVAVGERLQEQVFEAVPLIAQGLLGQEDRDREHLDLAFGGALVFLYRLLFCLHAEARRMLPLDNPHYADYSLQKLKVELAADIGRGRQFSPESDNLYNDLRALFRIVDRGDPGLDVNEYDGGLFSAAEHPYFEGRTVSDALLAPALDRLFRVGGETVDYADLSVRDLGTIYEHLLAYRLGVEGDHLVLEQTAELRHRSGSYFTPQQIVDLIVERTLDPLLKAISDSIRADGIEGEAALDRYLGLCVLDPATGSAHFLVSVSSRIALAAATDPGCAGIAEDEEILRRVAERCVYGVDLNPLALELAKLALWLSTAQPDRPLTFIDGLRVGNSLVGADLEELLEGETLFAATLAERAGKLLSGVAKITSKRSQTAEDVHAKAELAASAEALREPLEELADETIPASLRKSQGPAFSWEIEFPEVFISPRGELLPEGGFDAVVGNPPYIRIQELGRDLADYCRANYETASGSFDAYIPFLERGLSLLRPGGRLGFIVPNKFLKLDYGERLRDWFAQDGLVEELIDFGDSQLFSGATNYTCVLIAGRSELGQFSYRKDDGTVQLGESLVASVDELPVHRYSAQELGSGPWVLATGRERNILDAARRDSSPLSEVTQQIFQGLITSADKVYIVEDRGIRDGRRVVYSKQSDRELELEPDLLHSLASGTDVERYSFRPLRALLLFPYRRDGDQMRLLTAAELEELPLTAAYLREHEEPLRGREGGQDGRRRLVRIRISEEPRQP